MSRQQTMIWIYVYVVLVTLTGSRFWSFHGLPDVFYDIAEFLSAISLVVIVILNYARIDGERTEFNTNVWLFLLLPLISMIPAALFHNQSFSLSLSMLRTNFCWLLYFVLHIFNVPKKFVIQWMTVVGVVWALLTIIQQFTYPHYWFYTREEATSPDFIRAGMYRFMLDPQVFGVFIVVFYYNQFLSKWGWRPLLFVGIGLAGFYCYATRQFAAAILVCMAIVSLRQPGQGKYVALLIMAIAGVLLVVNMDSLFGSYIEMTNAQLGSDDIRVYAAKFFLFDYWPHWSTIVFGNGFEHMNSDYGAEIAGLGTNLGYFKGDVGIISPLSTFGLLYVLNILLVNIKGLRPVYYTRKTNYLPVLFMNSVMLLVISEYYAYPAAIPYFCMVFYLVDKSYIKKIKSERADEDELETKSLSAAQ